MKALAILFALYVCVSSGEYQTSFPEIRPPFEHRHTRHGIHQISGYDNNIYKLDGGESAPLFMTPHLRPKLHNKRNAQQDSPIRPPYAASSYDNKHVESNAKQTDDVINVFSNPTHKSYAGNEILRNTGVQNGITLNSRRSFDEDVDIDDRAAETANQAILERNRGFPHFVSENNQNFKKSHGIHRHPSWNQQYMPFHIYPVHHDRHHPDHNEIECHNLVDIINELRVILHTHDISKAKYSLQVLLKIIGVFIQNNDLQYAPLKTVMHEIGRVLLNAKDVSNNPREKELVQILQHFHNHELNHFLSRIRSHQETNLKVAVSKLTILLQKLKQTLIEQKYSEESITRVINHIVQWTVPLVGRYFEKECKVKTQQYILSNLKLALNVNLESVQHVISLEDFETQSIFGSLGDKGSLGKISEPKHLEHVGNLGGLENSGGIGNQVILGNVGDLGGAENLRASGNVRKLGEPGNQGIQGHLGASGNQGH